MSYDGFFLNLFSLFFRSILFCKFKSKKNRNRHSIAGTLIACDANFHNVSLKSIKYTIYEYIFREKEKEKERLRK